MERRRERRLLAGGFHALALAVAALWLYVRTLPRTVDAIPEAHEAEAAWWGLWPITYVPQPIFAGAVGAVVVCIAALWWMESGSSEVGAGAKRSVSSSQATHGQSNTVPTVVYVVSILLVAAFFLFPIVHTRWGDAYLLSRAVAWPDVDLRLTHSWQAPLDVFLHGRVWALLHERFGWTDAVPVYRLLSPLAGAIYLAAALGLARALRPGWIGYALVTTLGVMQLFFGYIENYSFAAAGVLLYLWLGIEASQGKRSLWAAAWALAITHAFHPSTIVLAPSLLYLAYRRYRDMQYRAERARGTDGLRAVVLSVALPMVVVGAGVLLLMEMGGHGIRALLTVDRPGGGDGSWFVPLFEARTRWEHYTMFSGLHLRDFVNEQLLVAPVVLPGLALSMLLARRARRGTNRTGASEGFAAVAACAYLLFVWVWNPDYGGQRDWDLFSLSAIPSAVWLAVRLSAIFENDGFEGESWHAVVALGPAILVQAIQTAAWVYQNTLPWEWPA